METLVGIYSCELRLEALNLPAEPYQAQAKMRFLVVFDNFTFFLGFYFLAEKSVVNECGHQRAKARSDDENCLGAHRSLGQEHRPDDSDRVKSSSGNVSDCHHAGAQGTPYAKSIVVFPGWFFVLDHVTHKLQEEGG